MCGIAGIWGPGDNRAEVSQMLDLLEHRGPDDSGMFSSEHGCIGMRRLAIMDPSFGVQPIHFGENRALVANGEIYNHPQLKSTLENQHHYVTGSDIETIAWLYHDQGQKAFPLMHGIFAVAIADGDRLVLARDALGVKPLYYGNREGPGGVTQWVFASELQALRQTGIEPRALPPGHIFTPDAGKQRYYEVPKGWVPNELQLDRTTEIRPALETAVESQLMSDVPVGVLLSGGLDSNLIAAIARRHIPRLHTFAVGLDRSPDLLAARRSAKLLGTIHHEKVITSQDIRKHLPEIVAATETWDRYVVRPAIPNYFAARLAAKTVKVVLTGEGADETFAGYWYHKHYRSAAALHQELRRCVGSLHQTNLQRADRMAMLHGVEARVPFLDTRMVEIGLAIDPRRKIRRPNPWSRRVEKYCLRKAFAGVLPDELLWRPKQTFNDGSGIDGVIKKVLGLEGKKDARALEEQYYKQTLQQALPHCAGLLATLEPWQAQMVLDGQAHPTTRRRPVLKLWA